MEHLIKQLSNKLLEHEWKLVTAESCTGGGVAYTLTNLAGSSLWYDRGFVTYSNNAKEEMLGVKSSTLTSYGAVSEQTAREMAEGALHHSQAQISVAITGIAGPAGGSPEKPVGTVWFAWASSHSTDATVHLLLGNRSEIRYKSIEIAIQGLLNRCR